MTDNEKVRELIQDMMNFEEWQAKEVPGWLYDLAEKIIDSGWTKREVVAS